MGGIQLEREPASRFRSLEDSESLRELVRRLKEGIYITTRDGQILDANPALLEMFGVASLEELRQHRAEDFLSDPSQRQREMELLDRHGAVRDFELNIRTPAGQTRTVVDTAYTCEDPETGEKLCHGVLVDITARKELEKLLLEQSVRDPLTGCFNRRYLADFEAGLQGHCGCIVIDIDHFKDYNDRYGHAVGDDVLVRMSRFLMRLTRAQESVVRLGGDEFLVLLRGADAPATEAAARRLQAEAASGAPVPFSMGWAAREDEEKLEKTIARADHRMLAIRVLSRTPQAERRAR
jgi:diguanylate cyclase (GGDEF)-like protein/PAS domain S-box-containing protein